MRPQDQGGKGRAGRNRRPRAIEEESGQGRRGECDDAGQPAATQQGEREQQEREPEERDAPVQHEHGAEPGRHPLAAVEAQLRRPDVAGRDGEHRRGEPAARESETPRGRDGERPLRDIEERDDDGDGRAGEPGGVGGAGAAAADGAQVAAAPPADEVVAGRHAAERVAADEREQTDRRSRWRRRRDHQVTHLRFPSIPFPGSHVSATGGCRGHAIIGPGSEDRASAPFGTGRDGSRARPASRRSRRSSRPRRAPPSTARR